jgi:thioredoxin reductase
MPLIKGLFNTEMELCTVVDVLEGKVEAGQKVIVLGGNTAALVVADFLADKGKEVLVLNRKGHFAEELSSNDRFYLRERLKQNGVKMIKDAAIKSFLPKGVTLRANEKDEERSGFDTVVIAEKMTSIRKPIEIFKGLDIPVHVIGDAKSPRILMHAIAEGEEIGRAL